MADVYFVLLAEQQPELRVNGFGLNDGDKCIELLLVDFASDDLFLDVK